MRETGMLQIRHLVKSFGDRAILRGVDLALAPGRVTALVGPNGAGKTTLIKCVLGLTTPDDGEILIDGKPAVGDAYRAAVGYMPQIARFPENLTGNDLIELLRGLRGADAITDTRLVDEFDLTGALTKPLRTLSGGTRQKVNAVLALLFAPKLLILDEPTAGLDPIAAGILKDRVARERDAGRTVLLTSHVSAELEELADDIVYLADGRVEFAGAIHALLERTEQPRLERAIAVLMRESISGVRSSLGAELQEVA